MITRALGRSRCGQFLVIWDHFRVAPDFFLIPANEIGNFLYETLQRAHGFYIQGRDIPADVHQVRRFLYGDNGSRGSAWRVSVKELRDNKHIIGVFHTGQYG